MWNLDFGISELAIYLIYSFIKVLFLLKIYNPCVMCRSTEMNLNEENTYKETFIYSIFSYE